jgi:nifR3 family TIM-barrel protein
MMNIIGSDGRLRRAAGLRIGSLEIFPPLIMAPMAGLTHVAFRRLLSELGGVGLYYSEMLSARSLKHESPGNSRFLSLGREDRPLCFQLFASEPEQIGPAVERGMLWSPEAWDFNFGCPAPAIIRQGAGSALLANPEKARAMAAEMRRSVDGPLLFKIRVLPESAAFVNFGKVCSEEGADCVVVHARRPREKLGRPAQWAHIAEMVASLDIPVVGNGDIRLPEDVSRMMETTGCRGVMIGRGAVERPWIFRHAARLFGAPVPPMPFRRKSDVFRRLSELLGETMEHPRDLYRLREFTVYFARNYKFGHQLWKTVQNAADMRKAVDGAEDFFSRQDDEDILNDQN